MHTPNIYISPSYTGTADKAEGGIRRVSEALHQHLPEFGWTPVNHPSEADLINSHATNLIEDYESIPVVQSSHGLMWSEYFNHEWDGVNAECVRALKRADAITAPSQWVAQAIQYGIACQPRVIPHGVDVKEWKPTRRKQAGGYALWNKARHDAVSDSSEVEKIAALMPKTKFVSTIGNAKENLQVVGIQPYPLMKEIVQLSGVYLALPRETFGIGILEALACGVPIAGWDYGGQAEIVVKGETGYLAPYGDWKALSDCVDLCFAERARLSENSRQDAITRWQWLDKIGLYAALFSDTLAKSKQAVTVSVIVTSYNLGRYLLQALDSVKQQDFQAWECIIVDDCSNDDTAAMAQQWVKSDPRFHYIKPDKNLGLPAARNFGIQHARGKYVLPLDADDMLTPDALSLLVAGMEADKSAHIGYGHLLVGNHDLTEVRDSGWRAAAYDWREQLNHQNQLHYSALIRREVFERTQGYRRRSWQAEDAEMWCYLTSFGFNAKRVTEKPTLIYRIRGDSKTRDNKSMGTAWSDGAWNAFYHPHTLHDDAPMGAQGKPVSRKFWTVSHHQSPAVSIVIPVSKAHVTLLQDALDSILAQTFTNWEVVVVNDSGQALDMRGYGFVKLVATEGNTGAGHARNIGVTHARAPLLVFLDADDLLQPTFLQDTLAVYNEREKKQALIYTDWYQEHGQGEQTIWNCREFDCAALLRQMIYNITVLQRKEDFNAVQGFDESLYGWEDWDYFIKLMLLGVDAIHLAKPLMTYRYQTGTRRDHAYNNKADLMPKIQERYQEYIAQGVTMACGCQSGKVNPPPPAKMMQGGDGMVLLEYTGNQQSTFRVVGKATENAYRFGAGDHHKQKYVYKDDVAGLIALRQFRIIEKNIVQNTEGLSPLIVRDRPQKELQNA